MACSFKWQMDLSHNVDALRNQLLSIKISEKKIIKDCFTEMVFLPLLKNHLLYDLQFTAICRFVK